MALLESDFHVRTQVFTNVYKIVSVQAEPPAPRSSSSFRCLPIDLHRNRSDRANAFGLLT